MRKPKVGETLYLVWIGNENEEYKELIRLNNEIKNYINENREPKITLEQAKLIKSILDDYK